VKSKRLYICLAVTLLLLAPICVAQTPDAGSPRDLPRIGAPDAAQHLLKKIDPVYPQMAKVAHIEGNVVLQATIAADGNVIAVKSVSGHPILIQAALDAVRQWRYQPFLLNGQPIQVLADVEVAFALPPVTGVRDIAERYRLEQTECAGLDNEEKYAEADAACQKALATAKELTDPLYDMDRQYAYHFASHVAWKLNRGAEALEDARQEVNLISDMTPSRTIVMSHLDLARSYDLRGQPSEAEAEYRTIENAFDAWKKQSQRLAKVGDAEMNKRRADALTQAAAAIREGHVKVLRKLDRNAEADALEKTASK